MNILPGILSIERDYYSNTQGWASLLIVFDSFNLVNIKKKKRLIIKSHLYFTF